MTNDILHKLILSLQQDLKDLRKDCAKLSEGMDTLKAFMVRAKTVEEIHNLPAKLDAHETRIDAIEKRETEFKSEIRGRMNMLKAVVAVLTFIATVLGVWIAIKQLAGR